MSGVWNDVTNEYELKQKVGLGSYGEVVAATHILSGKLVAIKLINNVVRNEYETKKVLREIQILRKFTQMKDNHFTV
jgi:serine/threonine protein kinase